MKDICIENTHSLGPMKWICIGHPAGVVISPRGRALSNSNLHLSLVYQYRMCPEEFGPQWSASAMAYIRRIHAIIPHASISVSLQQSDNGVHLTRDKDYHDWIVGNGGTEQHHHQRLGYFSPSKSTPDK